MVQGIARALLAVPFIADGIDAIRNPDRHVALAQSALQDFPGADAVPDFDNAQLTTIVRAHGAATIAAALTMATGKAPRLNALILAALTAPRLVTNEPFSAPAVSRPTRRTEFIRTLGLVGGALAVAGSRRKKPSASTDE
ncbi:DoxX protein [Micrococcales bacterium KH10]|nr:DoxX protein [Micrococcales bacterium KH10]